MPAARSALVLHVVAAVVGVGVVVALVLIVAGSATWTEPPPAAAPAGSVRTCTNDDLALGVEDLAASAEADPATAPRRLALVWRNTGSDVCRLEGFGVVDLVGPAAPGIRAARFGGILGARRDDVADTPPAVDLAPGQTARSVLRWTPPGPTAPRAWTPQRIVVATPGERRNQSLPWGYGPVPATGDVERPGVSFGPVTGD